MKRILLLTLTIATVLGSGAAAQSGYELLQQALTKERAEGKIQEAIAIYQRIARDFPDDHALAAKALVQLGKAYEKLGMASAKEAYDRVVSRYGDQPDLVKEATARLALLSLPSTAGKRAAADRGSTKLAFDGDAWSLSPRGRLMAYVDYSVGDNIATYDLTSGATKLITHFLFKNKKWEEGMFPVWSPDGKQLAYHYMGEFDDAVKWRHEIRLITLDGSQRTLYRAAEGAFVEPTDWLPGGRALVAVVQQPDKTYRIGLLAISDGTFTPLRSIEWDFPYGSRPTVSPDGRLVVFEDGREGTRDLRVVSVDGTRLTTVTDHPADDKQARWSPDGRHIAFLSQRGGSWALWGVAVRDGKAAGEPFLIRNGMENATLLNWTETGLSYQEHVFLADVYTIPVDRVSGEATGLAKQIAYSKTGGNTFPEWSPDSKSLAFFSSPRNDSTRYLVMFDTQSAQAREYAVPSRSYLRPLRWVTDGSGVAVALDDAKGHPSMLRLSLADGAWSTTPLPENSFRAQLTGNRGNSETFFYSDAHVPPRIIERNATTGSERVIYTGEPALTGETEMAFRGYRLSPDSTQLSITEHQPKHGFSIVIVDVQSAKGRFLTSGGAPMWSPDGQRIMFGANGPDGYIEEIKVMSAAGGGARTVLSVQDFAGAEPTSGGSKERKSIRSASWSPDGTRVAVQLTRSKDDVWVVGDVIPPSHQARSAARR